jgi:transposase
MNNRTRRTFDKSFKLMIVELHQSGKSSREIAREFDLPSDMVRRWSREHLSHGSSSFSGHGKVGLTEQEREIVKLKKSLKRGSN